MKTSIVNPHAEEIARIDKRLKEISNMLNLGRRLNEELTLKHEVNTLLDQRAKLLDS